MSMQEKQAARKKKRAKKATEPRHITRAVTRIRLTDVNAGKLAALDTLAPVYLTLCQMNAYLKASNLAHIPQQIKWNAEKRGRMATPVISAYSSQECSVCHYTSRKNRPDQQTFCCQVCCFEAHADHNAAVNLSRRIGDKALQTCHGRDAIKSLLMKRHEAWKQQHGFSVSPKGESRKRKPAVSSGLSLVM